MDGTAQRTGPLAMDDPDLHDAPFAALLEVVGNEILDVPGLEMVQIERAVDGQFDELVRVGIGITAGFQIVIHHLFTHRRRGAVSGTPPR